MVQKLKILALLSCLVLGMTSHVSADIVGQLYDERLAVEDQLPASLKKTAAEALERVFVRVSGRGQLRGNEAIEEALRSPEGFLTQYNYQKSATAPEQLMLDMRFSPRQVNAVLQAAYLPVWSANRPVVLVWLAADGGDGVRQFVSPDSIGGLHQSLVAEARRRGIALRFPLLDLVDAENLNVDQLWQFSPENVQFASSRYAAQYILMGRASQLSTGQWFANWQIMQAGEIVQRDSQGMSSTELVAPLIDYLADTQASRFSLLADGGGDNTRIQITGVDEFSSYAQLITYLEGLAVIEHANTVWLSRDELVLELVLKGDMEQVQRFLTLDGKLSQLDSRGATSSGQAVRGRYKWLGARL